MRPISNNTIRISTTSPRPPLGPYPQLRLCPQVGRAPMRIRIRTIRRMSEMDMAVFLGWLPPFFNGVVQIPAGLLPDDVSANAYG